MTHSKTVTFADAVPRPGVELRWPASAIWRPGEPAVHAIGLTDLRDAVAKGIEDFNAVPTHAVFLGIIYAVLGIILFRLSFGYDVLPLVYPMLAGFILLGPCAAIALYELSRRRERGLDVSAEHLLEVFRSPSIGAIVRLGLVLLAIFLAWLVAAKTMYAQIMGGAVPASLGEFSHQVLTTSAGWQLIVVGNAVGFVFRCLGAGHQRRIVPDAGRPQRRSRDGGAHVGAGRGCQPIDDGGMGSLRGGRVIVGSLPLFFGLAVVFPVLGHATWHLYRRIVSVDDVI